MSTRRQLLGEVKTAILEIISLLLLIIFGAQAVLHELRVLLQMLP